MAKSRNRSGNHGGQRVGKTSYSGKFVLRLPLDLHERLADRSRQNGLSLNSFCVDLLRRGVSEDALDSSVLNSLRKIYGGQGLIAVLLFGSRARGTALDSSDTDLLLVFEPNTFIDRDIYRKWERSDAAMLDPDLSIHCVALADVGAAGGLWFEVALDGIILWEVDRRTRELLSHLKRRIAEGRVVRDKSHGHGYWRKVS